MVRRGVYRSRRRYYLRRQFPYGLGRSRRLAKTVGVANSGARVILSYDRLKRLPAFNRPTGTREIGRRKKLLKWVYDNDLRSRNFNYPTDSARTRSLSLREFGKQTSDLKNSQYYIDQYRGGLQDTQRRARAKLPWSSDLDILNYQTRRILNQEEQEKAEPIRKFFDDLVNHRTRSLARARNVAIKREPEAQEVDQEQRES